MNKSRSKKPQTEFNIPSKSYQNLNNKTTNVNILLNRVRLDKKKDIKKKIIFLSLIISVVSIVTFIAFL